MAVKNLHVLPIVVFVWFPGTFVITYVMAVTSEKVYPIFPYISDTGTFSPESCVFGQFLNMGSALLALVMYIRYRQIRNLYENHEFGVSVAMFNKVSLWIGLMASFGITFVANFQETNIFSVHLVGAFMAFGLGAVYETAQTFISYKLLPILGSRGVNRLRAVLSFICSVGVITCFLFAGLSFIYFTGEDATKWNEKDGGYKFHLVSTISEWIVAICTMAFILTYESDFRRIAFIEPEIIISDSPNASGKVAPMCRNVERF